MSFLASPKEKAKNVSAENHRLLVQDLVLCSTGLFIFQNAALTCNWALIERHIRASIKRDRHVEPQEPLKELSNAF